MTPENLRNPDKLLFNKENREQPLAGRVALITKIRGSCSEVAVALAGGGAHIIGIVGNSRREQEDARKLAMHIEYNGGNIDLIYEDVKIPKEPERLLKAAVGRQGLDILVVHDIAFVDKLFPYMNRDGKIVLMQNLGEYYTKERERFLISRTQELKEKGISFFVVCFPEVEDTLNVVGQKVAGFLKRNDLPQGHVKHLIKYNGRGQ